MIINNDNTVEDGDARWKHLAAFINGGNTAPERRCDCSSMDRRSEGRPRYTNSHDGVRAGGGQ